jgi:AMP phosphorylase
LIELKARLIDISAGARYVLLNSRDADELGIHPHDRVRVQKGPKMATAIVDTTGTYIQPGEIGIFSDLRSEMEIGDSEKVQLSLTSMPESITYLRKKMEGAALTREEIHSIVQDIVSHNLSELEIAGFLVSQQCRGLTLDEVEYLTRAMVKTGETIDFERPVFDKHSIGGVPGNKVSLLIVPIVAASGLLIPKTSSRAITSPSGTADTMSVLAHVTFMAAELKEIVSKVGGAIVWGGALNIAPADDIMIRVEYPLSLDPRTQMLASIMAKKIAVGAKYLVIDIPIGHGTKVSNPEEARRLSREFIDLSERLSVVTRCAITYGAQPIGYAVGPALEAKEAIEALTNPDAAATSLVEKSTAIAGMLLEMAGLAKRNLGQDLAKDILTSGRALAKMKQIIEAQGGNPDPSSIDYGIGEHRTHIEAPSDGYITHVDNSAIAAVARTAGAPVDKGAGVIIHAKRGHKVRRGEPIMEIVAERATKLSDALSLALRLKPMTVEGMLLNQFPEY